MSSSARNWHHAGVSVVKDYRSRLIRIPNNIIGEGDRNPVNILEPGKPIYWNYDKGTKVVVISNTDLGPEYKYVTTSDFSPPDYRTSVGEKFWEDYSPEDKHELQEAVPEDVQFTVGEERHFIFNDRMASGPKKSCYVLTEEQYSGRFGDSDKFDLGSVPRFS